MSAVHSCDSGDLILDLGGDTVYLVFYRNALDMMEAIPSDKSTPLTCPNPTIAQYARSVDHSLTEPSITVHLLETEAFNKTLEYI